MEQKFKPILFSTDMIQAILDGRKTQTRRICNIEIKPSKMYQNRWNFESKMHAAFNISIEDLNTEFLGVLGLSKYQIDDILWVRETFTECKTPNIPNDRKWKFCYKADTEKEGYGFIRWKPSIHMPKKAARIFLKVIDVRCERLMDITAEDSIAEGIEYEGDINDSPLFRNYMVPGKDKHFGFGFPWNSFHTLWEKINGIKSLKLNPWIWVYTFKIIEKPENFQP